MSKIAYFIGGFVACLLLLIFLSLISAFHESRQPYGKISYNGIAVEMTSDDEKAPLRIGEQGMSLPYGMYQMKLRSGKALIIHKNNKGNAEVSERDGLVLVNTDHNVIDVRLEK